MDEQTRLENIVKWSSCFLKKQLVYYPDPSIKLPDCYIIAFLECKNNNPDEIEFDYFFYGESDKTKEILEVIIGVVQRFRNV